MDDVMMEKQSIYVPRDIKATLENDARLFEILHESGPYKDQINLNSLINRVIQGYYESYTEYCAALKEDIRNTLEGYIKKPSELSDAVIKLYHQTLKINDPSSKGSVVKISMRPTVDTSDVMNALSQQLDYSESLMNYISRMIISYSARPLYERERIVFRETYTDLTRYCKKGTAAIFIAKLTKKSHTVLPYRISVNNEEMGNYLLCQEYDENSKRYQARSYRLSRIESLKSAVNVHLSLQEDVKKHLDLTDRYASQYAINSDEIIEVSLSQDGVDLYNRIYTSRPVPKEIVQDGERYIYRFDCSPRQIILYFRRFEKDSALIVSPKRLRDQMVGFHNGVVKAYRETGR